LINGAATAWDAFQSAEMIMTRPFIAVVGDKPGGFGAYRDAHEILSRAASKEKRVVVIPDVSHYQLYDDPKAIKPALEEVLPSFSRSTSVKRTRANTRRLSIKLVKGSDDNARSKTQSEYVAVL
jgi:hypothetical protein